MDIFNLKKIEELKMKLWETECERDKYRADVRILTEKLEDANKYIDSTPENCTRGPWCKACEFVKTYHYTERYGFGSYSVEPIYVCGKGKSCECFVESKVEE